MNAVIWFFTVEGALHLVLALLVWREANDSGSNPMTWTLAAVLLPLLAGIAIYLHLRSTTPGLRRLPSRRRFRGRSRGA